jgi:hypothetical protein
MAKDHLKKYVIQARPFGTAEWGVRNDRLSHMEPVVFDVEKGLAEARRQIMGWQVVEPYTEFRVVQMGTFDNSHGEGRVL